MFAGQVINLTAQKGVPFTLYFPLLRSDSGSIVFFVMGSPSWTTKQISKDGGAFSATTNTPAIFGQGWYSLALTASEMTADKILISIQGSQGFNSSYAVEINTYSELNSAPSVNDNLLKKIQAVWQYLFLKRTVTASQETLYKSDNTTVLGTGSLSDNGTTFDKGKQS